MSSKYLDRVNEIVNGNLEPTTQIRTAEEVSKYIDKEKFANILKSMVNDLTEWFRTQGVSKFNKRTRVYYHPNDDIISISIFGSANKDDQELSHTIKRKIGVNGSHYEEYNTETTNQSKYDDFSPEMDMQMTLGDVKIPPIASTSLPNPLSKNPLDFSDPFHNFTIKISKKAHTLKGCEMNC